MPESAIPIKRKQNVLRYNSQMKPLAEQVFLGEIMLQSKIALHASKRLPTNHDHFDWVEVWCTIQSILVAAGNVSKILWPQKKFTKRGERLRRILNIAENNLLSDRKFRNHFEHYDERIEAWFEENRSEVYRDLSINPTKPIFGNTNNQHRTYNTMTQILTFRGESIDLSEVLKALEEIRIKCSYFTL